VVLCCVKFQSHPQSHSYQTSNPNPLSPTFPHFPSLPRRSQDRANAARPLVPCFHMLTNCPSRNSHPFILIQMPRGATDPRISMPGTLLPRKGSRFVTPLSAALTSSPAVSPLLATLTKTARCTPSASSVHVSICRSANLQVAAPPPSNLRTPETRRLTQSHTLRPIAVPGTRCQNYRRGGNSSAPPGV
jgi:hypothetical protein